MFSALQAAACFAASGLKVIVFAVGVGLLTLGVYNLVFHPLSRVPGPRLAAVSNAWLAFQAKHGRLAYLGRTLHQKYGQCVRVGPNEVWFNSKAAFKAIYSAGSGYEKSDFYLATALQRPDVDWRLQVHPVDTLDLLSERDMRRYRLQRRLIGPVYRPTNIEKHADKVDKVLDQVVTKLRSLEGAEVDLKEWMHIIAVECLGAVVLSWSPGLLKQSTDFGTSAHSYQAWRRKSVVGMFPTVAALEMCSGFIGRIFSWIWDIKFTPPPGFRPFFPSTGQRIGKRLKIARKGKDDRHDLAADLIRLHQEKPEFTEMYLRKMIMTNFGAGHETLASTLTSIMAMIAAHPEVQRKLTDEVLNGDLSGLDMPYLDAVIKESKRLYPVVSTALPRKVPDEGLEVDGVFIPAGTTVGCNPVALHRNPDVCGDAPHRFDPERWLESETKAREMELFSLAWGGGARSCPGRHLAEMIVVRVVTALARNFEISVEIPDESDMPSYFLSIMTGVKARFTEAS